NAVDDAVAAVQHGIVVPRPAVVQVLEPDGAVRAGTVEEVRHLAGGELVGGLGSGTLLGGSGLLALVVAVGDGALSVTTLPSAVFAIDRAHGAAGNSTGIVAVRDGDFGGDHEAADAAHNAAAGDVAGVGAVGDGLVAEAADAAHVLTVAGDAAAVLAG